MYGDKSPLLGLGRSLEIAIVAHCWVLVGAWSDCTWSMIGLTITISGSYMQVTFWLSVSLLSLNAAHVFCTVEQVTMEGQGMYVKMSNTQS